MRDSRQSQGTLRWWLGSVLRGVIGAIVLIGLIVAGVAIFVAVDHSNGGSQSSSAASGGNSNAQSFDLTRSGTVVHTVTVDESSAISLATNACRLALWNTADLELIEKGQTWVGTAVQLEASKGIFLDLYNPLLQVLNYQQEYLTQTAGSTENYDHSSEIFTACADLGVTGW